MHTEPAEQVAHRHPVRDLTQNRCEWVNVDGLVPRSGAIRRPSHVCVA